MLNSISHTRLESLQCVLIILCFGDFRSLEIVRMVLISGCKSLKFDPWSKMSWDFVPL